jgi:hypothetical protein
MDIGQMTEIELRTLGARLTRVRPGECLACYLERMLSEFGCTSDHRFTTRWRTAQPRPMPALMRWLADRGGCCCDCEVLLNVFGSGRRSKRHERLQCRGHYERTLRDLSA